MVGKNDKAIFTTRYMICIGETKRSNGLDDVAQVESVRADLMGVSFGIDFTGSTNFVVLPSVTARSIAPPPSTSATSATPAAEPVKATVNDNIEQQDGSSTAAVAATGVVGSSGVISTDGKGREGDSEEGKYATKGRSSDEPISPVEEIGPPKGKTDGDGRATGGGGEILNTMAARVSTEAFCRAVVVRVTVRDPKVGGTLKVRSGALLVEVVCQPFCSGRSSYRRSTQRPCFHQRKERTKHGVFSL